MKNFLLIIFILIFLQSASFGIEDVKKVYLQEAIDVAVENNIDLQAAKLEINIAKTISNLQIGCKIHLLKPYFMQVPLLGVNQDKSG